MLTIYAVKTKNEYYLSDNRDYGTYLKNYLVNGKELKESWHEKWMISDEKPTKLSKMIHQPNINHRFVIQDESFISEKLPKVINAEKDEDYDWALPENLRQYSSLYKLISDKQPDKEEVYEFEIEEILEIEKIVESPKFGYKIKRTRWQSDGFDEIDNNNVKHKLLERMLYPEIVLPQCPCHLTSQDTFKLVRKYIQDNINSKYAVITSDYEFCFTVKRRIPMAQTKTYTVDVNLFNKRKRSKYVERQQKERQEVCFEMTHKNENYKSYTPIEGFKADTHEELKEKIDDYCKRLIEFINHPFEECKHCNGDGFINNVSEMENSDV